MVRGPEVGEMFSWNSLSNGSQCRTTQGLETGDTGLEARGLRTVPHFVASETTDKTEVEVETLLTFNSGELSIWS